MRWEVVVYFLVYFLFLVHGVYQIVSIREEIWTKSKYSFAPAIWKVSVFQGFYLEEVIS